MPKDEHVELLFSSSQSVHDIVFGVNDTVIWDLTHAPFPGIQVRKPLIAAVAASSSLLVLLWLRTT